MFAVGISRMDFDSNQVDNTFKQGSPIQNFSFFNSTCLPLSRIKKGTRIMTKKKIHNFAYRKRTRLTYTFSKMQWMKKPLPPADQNFLTISLGFQMIRKTSIYSYAFGKLSSWKRIHWNLFQSPKPPFLDLHENQKKEPDKS